MNDLQPLENDGPHEIVPDFSIDENFKVKLAIIKFLEVFGGNTALNAVLRQLDNFYRVVGIAATRAIKKIEKRIELEQENNPVN